jgi:hypothetical protein
MFLSQNEIQIRLKNIVDELQDFMNESELNSADFQEIAEIRGKTINLWEHTNKQIN